MSSGKARGTLKLGLKIEDLVIGISDLRIRDFLTPDRGYFRCSISNFSD